MTTEAVTGEFDPDTGLLLGLFNGDRTRAMARVLNPLPYLGQVATRCWCPSTTNGNVSARGSTFHIARDNIVALKLVYSNWVAATAAEAGNGAPTTFAGAVEYPLGSGVIVGQAKWNGATQVVAASGADVESDFIVLSTPIPSGAAFRVHSYAANANGMSFVNALGSTGLDFLTAGPAVPDTTMAPATVLTAATTTVLCPTAIVAYTTKPSVLITGDSIAHGTSDTNTGAPGDQGIFARSIGQFAGYIGIALPGEPVSQFVTTASAKRRLLKRYASHVVSDYGTQDLGAGAALWLTNIAAAAALFAEKAWYQSTIIPRTTSTDAWATTANQTVTANEAQRLIMNGHIKNGNIPGMAGYFDTAHVLESSVESGLWGFIPGAIAPATSAYTPDGTHPSRTAYMRVQARGCIQASAFVR